MTYNTKKKCSEATYFPKKLQLFYTGSRSSKTLRFF